jgi:DNA primase
MPGNISPQIIEEIRSRSEIVEVISRYLPLKARGKNYYGLCPFHAEKTPSFAVNQEKQIFHCFGCGVGGDVFGFLMKKESLSFGEAVRFLANQYGVLIPSKRQTPQALQKLKDRQKLFEINEAAAGYFQKQLQTSPAGQKAAQYLVKRGISLKTQAQFKLGYAPSGWDNLLKYMQSKGINPLLLQQAGLAVKRENQEGFYDRFRERLIFPIYDYRQRLIGFGGRSLDEEKNPPKYLNSPETPIYHKGEGFYGLNWSKEALRKAEFAIIVEGYLDFIALQQAGIENVVASLGTAFTQRQAQLISHYTNELVLFFDADLAGTKAATRSFPLFLGSKLRVKVGRLPAGSDPDSFVRQHGAQALSQQVEQAVSLLDFVLTEAVSEVNTDTVEGQIEAANRVLPLLAQLPNALERSSYVGKVAQHLGLKEQLLRRELEKAAAKRQRTLSIDKTKILGR